MLRLNEHPIGDTHPLYQTFRGLLEHPGKSAVHVVVKVLRKGKTEEEEDEFEDLFSRTYKAADLGDEVVYYRNYIKGETLKEYLTRAKPDDNAITDLSTKLLSFLNFLHIEKQFHNKLTSYHVLIKDKQIYLISGNSALHKTPQKDIEAFGEVLNEMLGSGQKSAFYKDILAKCRGGNDYFRTISDILYRFKNRVTKIEHVPKSFDKYVIDQFNKNGYPPSKSIHETIDAQAYRMVIDEGLINQVIIRNADKATPMKTHIPRWAYLIIPVFLILGVAISLVSNKGSKAPIEINFDTIGDKKKELNTPYQFISNQHGTRHLKWKLYDYNGRKIIQEENKNRFDYTPEKPGKYFVTLEHKDNSKNIHKDTIEVMWPGGKAQFSVQQTAGNRFILTNESPFADSVFYDMGDGLVKMTTKTIEYEYKGITQPEDVAIQFAAYANGQADLQTKKFRVTKPKNKPLPPTPAPPTTTTSTDINSGDALYPPTIEPELVKPVKPKTAYKKPLIRANKPNYEKQTIVLRLSSSTINNNLTYEWEVSGQKQTGQSVTYSTKGQTVMQVFVRAMKDGKIIHTSSQMVSVQPKKDDSPFKIINNTDLFKKN